MVRCLDGTDIEVHASYKFNDNTWKILPEAEKKRILKERSEYKRSRYNNYNDDRSTISQITTGTNIQTNDLQSVVHSVQQLQSQINDMNNRSEHNSNNTPPTSIMGGRNEQANLRSRNHN